MTDVTLVLITAPNAEKAAELGKALVTEKLAACVNIVPGMRSIYTWEDKLCDEAEVLMIAKTRASLFEPLRERVLLLHPYQCPEILQFQVGEGHPPYLEWVRASVRS